MRRRLGSAVGRQRSQYRRPIADTPMISGAEALPPRATEGKIALPSRLQDSHLLRATPSTGA